MVPEPEFASPPETVQVTVAPLPLVSVAENCSTGTLEEVALQPVQLVSIEAVPGETENAPLIVPDTVCSNRQHKHGERGKNSEDSRQPSLQEGKLQAHACGFGSHVSSRQL